MNKKTTIQQKISFLDSTLLTIIIAVLGLLSLGLGIVFILTAVDFISVFLIIAGLTMMVLTLYSLSHLYKVVYITDGHFILARPFAGWWFKKVDASPLKVKLLDIDRIIIEKTPNAENGIKESWKVILKSRSTATFPFKVKKTHIQYLAPLKAMGINIQTSKPK